MRISFLAIAIALMLFTTVGAQEGESSQQGEQAQQGERGGRGQRGGRQQRGEFDVDEAVKRIFEQDANSDGKISKDEGGERMEPLFESSDDDKDGFLSKDELKKALSERQQGQGRNRARGGPTRTRTGSWRAWRRSRRILEYAACHASVGCGQKW